MSAFGLGRLYTVTFQGVTVSAQQDFFYIKPAADKLCIVEMVKLVVTGGTADAGDAQEELLRVECLRLPVTVTASSGGTAPTIVPVLVGDAAAGFTARANDTTKATTSGTAAQLDSDGMNNRIPYLYTPIPEHRDVITNAGAFVVRLMTTPADALEMGGSVRIREFA